MSDDESPFVVTYDSFEEMLEDQRRKEEAANAAVLPIQAEKVVWDSYAAAYHVATGTWIYGRIWSREELREKNTVPLEEAQEYGYESVEAFLDAEDERWQEIYGRGYRTGTWFSTMDPICAGPGEIGDHHISGLWPISKEIFEEAKAAGWAAPEIEQEIAAEHHDYLSTFTDK